MALNIDKIKARLQASQKKGSQVKQNILWKPEKPSQVIRIVPLQSCPDDPFVRLRFYYDFGDKTYLSPASFGKPDPIVELAATIKKKGNVEKNKELWKSGANLEPKLRTYVPIIVRGEEEKGVRYWGFGGKLNTQLEQLATDPDYGDITSLTDGYDLNIFYKTPKEAKNDYGEVTFSPKPKPRPAIDPTDPKAKELLELITTKQPDLLSCWEVPTYETLAGLLSEFLKKGESKSDDDDSNVVMPTEEQIAAASAPAPVAQVVAESAPTPTPAVTAVVSPSAVKAATPASTQDLTKAFDNIFNS